MNTEIANAVNAAGDKAQYDTHVKRLLAQKSILAHILVKTVDEFKGMKPEDVVKYIEGEPSISVVPVEPGLANMEKTEQKLLTRNRTWKHSSRNLLKKITKCRTAYRRS